MKILRTLSFLSVFAATGAGAIEASAQAHAGCYMISGQSVCSSVLLPCEIADPVATYGFTAGSLCIQRNDLLKQRNDTFLELMDCINTRGQMYNDFMVMESQRDTAVRRLKTRNATIKSLTAEGANLKTIVKNQSRALQTYRRTIADLRRACGSRCSKIR